MNNFRELKADIMNLEDYNEFLFNNYRALAENINIFILEYQIINEDEDFYNFNFEIYNQKGY